MTDLATLPLGSQFDPQRDMSNSRAWFRRAQRSLAGGISSSARSTLTAGEPFPLFMDRGVDGRVIDVDGNTFVDFLLAYGSLLLGHAHPRLIEALSSRLAQGTMFGTCNTGEVELAEAICELVPCAELVRFSNSGSEAVCGAIRAARGYTGRNKILKFEGHYHGWVDVLAVSNRPELAHAGPADAPRSVPHSLGVPQGVVQDVVTCPWNNADAFTALMEAHGEEIAAVIAEPIVANNGCIMPEDNYLEHLREECSRRGVVLIFDEIVTGFRVGPGGAQELFGVVPDIAVFSKALGGGLPISAFAGNRKFMDPVGSNRVKHGGTYNGNPLCAAAGVAVLREITSSGVLQKMHERGEALMEAVRRAAFDHRIPCHVQGAGGMFQVLFTPGGLAVHNYRELLGADFERYGQMRDKLLRRGVQITSSGMACWFISTAHTDDDIEIAAAAIYQTFAELS